MGSTEHEAELDFIRRMTELYKREEEGNYGKEDKVLWRFKEELLAKGFQIEVLQQALSYMPKYKSIILPMVEKYYEMSKENNERRYLLQWMNYKGLEEAVPFLLRHIHDNDGNGWDICDTLYKIRSKKYLREYLEIIADKSLGRSRQMLFLLMGEWKVEASIAILIEALEEDDVRLHAICALGDFKREEFKPYFERFINSKHPGWRKYAKLAMKKLEMAKE